MAQPLKRQKRRSALNACAQILFDSGVIPVAGLVKVTGICKGWKIEIIASWWLFQDLDFGGGCLRNNGAWLPLTTGLIDDNVILQCCSYAAGHLRRLRTPYAFNNKLTPNAFHLLHQGVGQLNLRSLTLSSPAINGRGLIKILTGFDESSLMGMPFEYQVNAWTSMPAAQHPLASIPSLTKLRLNGCPGEDFTPQLITLLHEKLGIRSLDVFVCARCESPAEPVVDRWGGPTNKGLNTRNQQCNSPRCVLSHPPLCMHCAYAEDMKTCEDCCEIYRCRDCNEMKDPKLGFVRETKCPCGDGSNSVCTFCVEIATPCCNRGMDCMDGFCCTKCGGQCPTCPKRFCDDCQGARVEDFRGERLEMEDEDDEDGEDEEGEEGEEG